MVGAGLWFKQASFDDDTCRLEHFYAPAADARVAVGTGDDNAGHPCVDQRERTGWRFAGMGAWFQSDVGYCPTGRWTGLCQRMCFRVRPAAGLGPATTHHAVVVNNHASHRRVWPNTPLPASAQRQGQRHIAGVL